MFSNIICCAICGTRLEATLTTDVLRPLCHTCKVNEGMRNVATQIVAEPDVKPSETRAILTERGKRYGKFSSHAAISQALLEICQGSEGDIETSWGRMAPHQREALTLIMHKIARILNGDPDYDDTWKDMAGYSQLVVDILNKDER